jgi:hypothetical protein
MNTDQLDRLVLAVMAITAVIIAINSVVTRLTRYWRHSTGSFLSRLLGLLLLLAELLSAWTSKGVPQLWKWPLTLRPPDGGPSKPKPPGAAGLFLLVFVVGACGMSWTTATRTSIDALNDATALAWEPYQSHASRTCVAKLKDCEKERTLPDECEPAKKCLNRLKSIGLAVAALHATVAHVRQALDELEDMANCAPEDTQCLEVRQSKEARISLKVSLAFKTAASISQDLSLALAK